MKCTSRQCAMQPDLRATGYGDPHPTLYCPVCKTGYWLIEKGITNAWTGKLEEYSAEYKTYPKNGQDPEIWYKDHSYWWQGV